MSEISALAVANTLTQAVLPLIQAAAAPQTQGSSSPSSSTEDTVSIFTEVRELQGKYD